MKAPTKLSMAAIAIALFTSSAAMAAPRRSHRTHAPKPPPTPIDPIQSGLVGRAFTVDVGGGALSAPEPSTLGPVFAARFHGFLREGRGTSAELLRVGFATDGKKHRVGLSILEVDEFAIGERSGKPCVPALFLVWPPGECLKKSGWPVLGLTAGAFDRDVSAKTWTIRAVEARAGISTTGPAFDPKHHRLRLPVYVGTGLDWAGHAIPRFVAGTELMVRSEDSHVETAIGTAIRPSYVEGSKDMLFEATARITWRWRLDWSAAFALQGITVDGGYGHASRPQSALGELWSHTSQDSAWLLLRFEVTPKVIL